jgi:hypothetical protein
VLDIDFDAQIPIPIGCEDINLDDVLDGFAVIRCSFPMM